MTSDPDGARTPPRRRRTRIAATEREYWRRVFVDEVFRRRRIRNLIEQELRPLWNAVDLEIPRGLDWRELGPILDAIQAGDLVHPSRRAYMNRREQVVLETLRCQRGDSASPWVMAFLQLAVMDRLGEEPFLPDPDEEPPPGTRQEVRRSIPYWPNGEPAPLFEMNLLLQAGPFGAFVQADTLMINSSERVGPAIDLEFPDATGRWDDWNRFEAEARNALEQQLAAMRRTYDDLHPEQINVVADEARHQDVQHLVAYLVDREPFGRDPARRERLRRLAALLGLNFPVP